MKRLYRLSGFLVLVLFILAFSFSCHRAKTNPSFSSIQEAWSKKQAIRQSELVEKENRWVDSVFKTLSLEEQIGQLFMVAAFYNDSIQINQTINLIKNQGIGGVIFFKGTAKKQAKQTNHYQSLSRIPLLVGLDAEWGLNMRLEKTINFPKQMTLGALKDTVLIYEMGLEIGRQLQRIGVHINFAPVVDVNNNPNNPVIGYRSFGENPQAVASKAIAYMQGLQAAGIIANAKHFPGHGDTNKDSHVTLPVINHNLNRLNQVELYPFNKIIEAGIQSIMVAHLHVPALGSKAKLPTTLSPSVVTEKLRKDMKFKGLIVTDALNMKGVTKFYRPGEVDLKALAAGNDLLLYPLDVEKGIERIKQAIEENDSIVTKSLIEKKVRKILKAKFKAGLNNYKPISLDHLQADLTPSKAFALKQSLYEKAVTLINNSDKNLPIKELNTKKIAILNIGLKDISTFKTYSNKYTDVDLFEYSLAKHYYLADTLKDYDLVLVAFRTGDYASNKFNINFTALRFLQRLALKVPTTVTVFGSPYSLVHFQNFKTLICAYEADSLMQKAVIQAIFGANGFSGKLPVSVGFWHLDHGINIGHLGRLGFSYPESVGLASEKLKKIDSIALKAIRKRATPGCQVLVAKNRKIIFQKSYGYQTYQKKKPITNNTLYDLASLTKVLGTLQAIMLLDGVGLLDIEKNVATYLTELEDHDEGKVKIRDILGHQAGLIPYIEYWSRAMLGNRRDELEFDPTYFSYQPRKEYNIQVSQNIFAINHIFDTIWQWTLEKDISKKTSPSGKHKYNYSDVGFYILQAIVERLTQENMASFLKTHFYKPLNLRTLTYRPLEHFTLSEIAPTEYDLLFRMDLVKGHVHDPGAALKGGIAGHAGLFSTSVDIATLLQMNLQNGYYGGNYYLHSGIIRKYTRYNFLNNNSRRGLGWDKPSFNPENYTPTCPETSKQTFGHTGFTGTCAWVDPANNLIYIFLSNRTFPSAANKKLIRDRVRKNIHSLIYKALI